MRRIAEFGMAFILGALLSDVGEPLIDWQDGPIWHCDDCPTFHSMGARLRSDTNVRIRT